MKAQEIMDALYKRACWSDDRTLKIEEAPDGSDRMGRKIDLLILNLWRSQGLGVEAVEIKVSTSDLRNEIANPKKADFWWKHSDRFWLATTPKVYKLCKDEIPESWGVITVDGDACRVAKAAPKREREVIPHGAWIGICRASADAGMNALERARSSGYREGSKDTEKRIKSSADLDYAISQYKELQKAVQKFEQISGVRINQYSGDHLGERMKLASNIEQAMAELARANNRVDDAIKQLSEKVSA